MTEGVTGAARQRGPTRGPVALLIVIVAVVALTGGVLSLALVSGLPGGQGPSLSPPPSPDSRAYNPGAVYGSAIGMDGLNNTIVGGPDGTSTSYRFRATTTAALGSIRIYVMGPQYDGYGAGTGGTFEVTVQTDDGTTRHAPSGTVLATTTLAPAGSTFPTASWPSPAALTAGSLYHVVFRNVDPDPGTNYASVNGVFLYEPTSPRQPAFSDVDWGQPFRKRGGPWSDSADTIPIMQLTYANGVTAGEGYMEAWIRSAKTISGDATARESFTVSGASRSVTSFSVRLMRLSGDSPLTLRLETADGTLIEGGTIAASDIAIGVPGDHGDSGHATWETWTFSAGRTLEAGTGYRVVLSTASDSVYSVFVIRKGTSYGFGSATVFADGRAQYSANGSTWTAFSQDGGSALDEGDLQFYFR